MRKITSLTLAISGVIELITSVVLYILPSGRVAYWSNYKLLGLSKVQWGNIHITVGTLFLIMGALHIYFNWPLIIAYVKNKAKKITVFTKNFNIALLMTLYVTIGTLYSLPPMNFIIGLGEYFTETANEKNGEPPYGHAELSSLKMFCSRVSIDLGQAMDVLQGGGITFKSEGETIGEISENNDLTPQQLYNMIKAAAIPQEVGKSTFPEGPTPGFGKKTIKDICQMYNLSLVEVLAELEEKGLPAQADDTIKEISLSNNSNPMEIFELLKDMAR